MSKNSTKKEKVLMGLLYLPGFQMEHAKTSYAGILKLQDVLRDDLEVTEPIERSDQLITARLNAWIEENYYFSDSLIMQEAAAVLEQEKTLLFSYSRTLK